MTPLFNSPCWNVSSYVSYISIITFVPWVLMVGNQIINLTFKLVEQLSKVCLIFDFWFFSIQIVDFWTNIPLKVAQLAFNCFYLCDVVRFIVYCLFMKLISNICCWSSCNKLLIFSRAFSCVGLRWG
jgi:hypothetical protein